MLPQALRLLAMAFVSGGLFACAALPDGRAPLSPGRDWAADVPLAERIATVARQEHALWYAPFIDADGRLSGLPAAEAEARRLADGRRAWAKVADYWQQGGTLAMIVPRHPPAASCAEARRDAVAAAICRSFIVDVPWSAAFVSYVMAEAGVPQFAPTPSHIDYIRAAFREQGPYRLRDPQHSVPAVGDLLCYLREQPQIAAYAGLQRHLAQDGDWLPSHCDVVVALYPHEVWLVGGNIAHTVALRKLRRQADGRLQLPYPEAQDGRCAPDNEAACHLNRQNWVALLQLQPALTAVASMK